MSPIFCRCLTGGKLRFAHADKNFQTPVTCGKRCTSLTFDLRPCAARGHSCPQQDSNIQGLWMVGRLVPILRCCGQECPRAGVLLRRSRVTLSRLRCYAGIRHLLPGSESPRCPEVHLRGQPLHSQARNADNAPESTICGVHPNRPTPTGSMLLPVPISFPKRVSWRASVSSLMRPRQASAKSFHGAPASASEPNGAPWRCPPRLGPGSNPPGRIRECLAERRFPNRLTESRGWEGAHQTTRTV
jgi:hypothetical protein